MNGGTRFVIALTAAMMVGGIFAGAVFGSMALMADGFHMATHAAALTITAVAYLYARRHLHDPRFAFGTGKLGELAGHSSAIILALIALLIGAESLMRLAEPLAIRFDEAVAVAVLGLVVNLASAWLLRDRENNHRRESRDQHRNPPHAHVHRDRDHNLHSAYVHVVTDALTSILAIVGLLASRLYGWLWMDSLMGIVGAVVIAHWFWGLMRGPGTVLLDMAPNKSLAAQIRNTLECDNDRICDLHLWRLGLGHMAAIISLVSDRPQAPAHYKAKLKGLIELSHATVEVHACGQALK